MAQLMPLPLTFSCSSKIQIGFYFLVPAYPGCPGKEAVKWLLLLYVQLHSDQMHPSVKNRKQELADNKQMLQSNINMESKQPQSATTVPVLKSNKYQLLELNPCDAWPHAHHALQTQLDAQCDKMIFDLRQCGQLSLTDDGPVYHTNRPTLIRTS